MPTLIDYIHSSLDSVTFDADDFLNQTQHQTQLNGKSIFSEILFPSFLDSSLARYLTSCDRIDLVKRFLKSMRPCFDVLDIPLDHDQCHPLHYAMMSPDITIDDFETILDLMILHSSILIPDHEQLDIDVKRRLFLESFMLKYEGFSGLYAQYLQQIDVTSKQSTRVISWLRKQSLPCEITKKYDFICRYVNPIQLSCESTIQFDSIIDIIRCVFPQSFSRTSPYRFMYHCPHLFLNLVLCVQRTFNLLQEGNINPTYLPLHTKQGVECPRYDDPIICDHYRKMHQYVFSNHCHMLISNSAHGKATASQCAHDVIDLDDEMAFGDMSMHHCQTGVMNQSIYRDDSHGTTSQRESAQLVKLPIAGQAQLESSSESFFDTGMSTISHEMSRHGKSFGHAHQFHNASSVGESFSPVSRVSWQATHHQKYLPRVNQLQSGHESGHSSLNTTQFSKVGDVKISPKSVAAESLYHSFSKRKIISTALPNDQLNSSAAYCSNPYLSNDRLPLKKRKHSFAHCLSEFSSIWSNGLDTSAKQDYSHLPHSIFACDAWYDLKSSVLSVSQIHDCEKDDSFNLHMDFPGIA